MSKGIAFLVSCMVLFCQFSTAGDQEPVEQNDSISADQVLTDDRDPAMPDTVVKKVFFTVKRDSLLAYRSAKDFKYMHDLDSVLKKTQESRDHHTGSIAGRHKAGNREESDFFSSLVAKTFFWMLAVGFIGFILYRLFLTESIFRRNPRKKIGTELQDEAAAMPAAFDVLIEDAVINKDFRLAIRYLFLQTLQKLSDKGLIQLSGDKTNIEYRRELSGSIYQSGFSHITLNYEYAWYGKFEVTPRIFQLIEKDFKQFNEEI